MHTSVCSCDTHRDSLIAASEDIGRGLSMIARELYNDGTVVVVKGQHSNIFKLECKFQDKVRKLTINGVSFTNAISSNLVHALSLLTRRLPVLCYIQWTIKVWYARDYSQGAC